MNKPEELKGLMLGDVPIYFDLGTPQSKDFLVNPDLIPALWFWDETGFITPYTGEPDENRIF